MNCRSDIEKLAESKLLAADILLKNGFYDDAYYLAGYAVELLLKAMVCKTLKIDDFFAFNKGKPEMYKAYKVHNYTELLILSGIYAEFVKSNQGQIFKENWSIVNTWKEDCRYLTGKSKKDVEDFVTSVKEFCQWIRNYL